MSEESMDCGVGMGSIAAE